MTAEVTRKARRVWLYVEGVVLLAVGALVLALVYMQFRGDFTPKTELTMVASRAGLVMEPGAKVTFNGVAIGRVASISEIEGHCRAEKSASMRSRHALRQKPVRNCRVHRYPDRHRILIEDHPV